jgi:hypothetical protein
VKTKLILFFLVGVVFSSCNFHIEKRKHLTGYFISKKGSTNKLSTNSNLNTPKILVEKTRISNPNSIPIAFVSELKKVTVAKPETSNKLRNNKNDFNSSKVYFRKKFQEKKKEYIIKNIFKKDEAPKNKEYKILLIVALCLAFLSFGIGFILFFVGLSALLTGAGGLFIILSFAFFAISLFSTLAQLVFYILDQTSTKFSWSSFIVDTLLFLLSLVPAALIIAFFSYLQGILNLKI